MTKAKKFIEQNFKEIIITLFVFIFFLVLFRITPMMFDGWIAKTIYNSRLGIIDYIKYVLVDSYNYINGRIMSNIVCGILESFTSEWLLDIFNALVLIGIYILLYKNLNIKNKKINYFKGILLYMAMVLLISVRMRNEVLFYANTAYIFPVFLILLYYDLYKKILNNDKNKISFLLLVSVITFSISTWIEHISVSFTIILCGIFIYSLVKKNKHLFFNLFQFALSLAGNIVMFLAPGLKAARTIISETSIIETIFLNVKNFYVDIISENPIYIFLISILAIFIVLKKVKGKNLTKTFSIILMSILAVTSGLNFLNNYIPLDSINYLFNFYSVNVNDANIMVIMLVLLGILIAIFNVIKLSKNKLLYFYLISIAIFSLAPMCLTPNSGPRISFIGDLILILTISIQFLELGEVQSIKGKDQIFKIVRTFIIILLVISIDNIILLEKRLQNVNIKRNRIIDNVITRQEIGEWDYNNYVFLPVYNDQDFLFNGAITMDSFYYPYFLKAEGLNSYTKVYFGNSQSFATSELKDNKLITKIVTNSNAKYNYKYYIHYSKNSFEDIYEIDYSDITENNYYEYDTKGIEGYYRVLVNSVDNFGEEVMIGVDYFRIEK